MSIKNATQFDTIPEALFDSWVEKSLQPKVVKELLEIQSELQKPKVFHVDGNLECEDLNLFDSGIDVLVVDGSVEIEGAFFDNDHPATTTLFLGDVSAGSIVTSGHLEVHGSLRCDNLFGDYNDYGAHFASKVTAHLFLPENHAFYFQGETGFEFVYKPGDKASATYGEFYENFSETLLDYVPFDDDEWQSMKDDQFFDVNRKLMLDCIRNETRLRRYRR